MKWIDLWDGHHRLVAYLNLGYETIGQIPQHNLKVLINGVTDWGEKWGHYLPVGTLSLDLVKDSSVVRPSEKIFVGTLSVNGAVSNYDLGSRSTVGKMAENTFNRKHPAIGIIVVKDPSPEIIPALQMALKSRSLSEVILVPGEKWSSEQINSLVSKVLSEKGINLYVEDPTFILKRFGMEPLFEKLHQIYGTQNIVHIMTLNSFRDLTLRRKIPFKHLKTKFLVLLMPGQVAPSDIPENISRNTTFISQ